MNRRVLCLGALALLCGSAFVGGADPAPPSVRSLEFLAGDWEANKWGGDFRAHYSTPAGKVLSHSTQHKDKTLAFYEFEVFEVKDGKLTLTPYPGGTPAAQFSATSIVKNKVVFENPKKDFPTRIVYERPSKDLLRITLDDPHHEGGKSDVFELQRVVR